MRIAVILAGSQADKGAMIAELVKKYAAGAEVIDFCRAREQTAAFSYIEISVLVGLLLAGGAVDFVVTGCSSGQGMMLACNSMPGVLCGYIPTPMDAYLFAQINNGNAVSLPLGENYIYAGRENLERTLEKLFSEPFGQGWPKQDAERKLRDTRLLKSVRAAGQRDMLSLLGDLDGALLKKALTRRDVVEFILENGTDDALRAWLERR